MPQRLEATYRSALVEAWRFVSTHKMLWLLGAMSAVFGGFSFGNFMGRLWHYFNQGIVATDFWWLPASWRGLTDFRLIPALDTLTLLVILLSVGLLMITIGIISQGAILAAALSYGRTRMLMPLAKAWHQGVACFWQLLGIKIIEQCLLIIILFFTVAFWNILPPHALFFSFVRVILLALGLFLGIAVSAMSIFAAGYVVDKKYTLSQAITEGWVLFCQHVLVSVELSVLFTILTAVVVVVVGFAAYAATVFGLFLMLIGAASSEPFLTSFGITLAAFLFVVATAIIGGFFNAYVMSGWMYCFARMHRKGVPSRLAHYVERFSQA